MVALLTYHKCERLSQKNVSLSRNVYILGVFTENLYSKPLERNVVYIPTYM